MLHHVVIALSTLSLGSAAPASCDGNPYDEQKTNGYYGTLTFTVNPNKDSTYPPGTHVALSCPRGFGVEGPKESACNSGQWLPKLGRCSNGFDCIFGEEQRKWGYSRMINPWIPYYEDPNVVRYANWAWFKCHNVSVHTFSCYLGQWKPNVEHDNRCGCAELKGEGTSFTYTSPLNELGRYNPETSVTISCSGNLKPIGALSSKCMENKWEPSPATCRLPCNDNPYGKYSHEPSNGHATLIYTNDPYDDGTYSHNTRVTLSCTSGPAVKGSEESVCNNGQWEPKLGRCPNFCSLEVLTKEKSFDTAGLFPYQDHGWQKHLGYAHTSCYFPHARKTKGLWLICLDGKWDPEVTCVKS